MKYPNQMNFSKNSAFLFAVTAIAAAFVGFFVRLPNDATMEPTLSPFTPIWISKVPTNLVPGTLLWITDPLDQKKTIVRRLIALPGQRISIRDHVVRINKKSLYLVDMDVDKSLTFRHFEERDRGARINPHTIRHRTDTKPWSASELKVPNDHVYVLCDDRDRCLDSRWWGPIPRDLIVGIAQPIF